MDGQCNIGHTFPMQQTNPTSPANRLFDPDKEQVARIIDTAQATRAEEIVVYDMQNRSAITDYVLICSGRSQAHVRGISDRIEASLREQGTRCSSVEGYQEGSWVLLDYGIVIVHIFHPETREYYDLDTLLESYPAQRVAPLESASA